MSLQTYIFSLSIYEGIANCISKILLSSLWKGSFTIFFFLKAYCMELHAKCIIDKSNPYKWSICYSILLWSIFAIQWCCAAQVISKSNVTETCNIFLKLPYELYLEICLGMMVMLVALVYSKYQHDNVVKHFCL